jgi:hypothetical protein
MIVIIAGKGINPTQVTGVTMTMRGDVQVGLSDRTFLILDEAKVRADLWDPEQPTLDGVVALLNAGLADDAYRIGLAISRDDS